MTSGPGGDTAVVTKAMEDSLVTCLHDRMTECRYASPITTFDLDIQPDAVYDVDVMGKGREALEKANLELGKWCDFNKCLIYRTLILWKDGFIGAIDKLSLSKLNLGLEHTFAFLSGGGWKASKMCVTIFLIYHTVCVKYAV